MFSLLPELLFLAPLGALIIRAAAAAAFAVAAYSHLKEGRSIAWYAFGIAEVAVVLSLAFGVGAQAGALLGMVVVAFSYFMPGTRTIPGSTSLILLAMCLSILVTGAGAFAVDLPL